MKNSNVAPWMRATGALLVLAVGIGVAIFARQAQTASAAEGLYQLQVEAAGTSPAGASCAPANATLAVTGGVIAVAAGSGDPGAPVTVSSSDTAQLSDKLAQALGVSTDRVRQAMRQTLSQDLPYGPPPDPVAAIAKQLGVSTEQVCAALFNPQTTGATLSSSSNGLHTRAGAGERNAVLAINGTAINLDTQTADQLSGPAQKLGVTPERLLAVIKATAPAPPPGASAPPNPDDLINRFAQNVGVSPDKVRAAMAQVEGPNHFYFAVPLPDFGPSS